MREDTARVRSGEVNADGYRYTIIAVQSPFAAQLIGGGANHWVVSVQGPRRDTVYALEGEGLLHWRYVAEKFGHGESDEVVDALTLGIAAVLGREPAVREEATS